MNRPAEEILEELYEEPSPEAARAADSEQAAPSASSRPLAAGRRLSVATDGATVEVTSPDGTVELHVEITPAGPVLRFANAALSLAAQGEVNLDCERLNLRSRGSMRLESGDFEQRVAGGYAVAVRDDARFAAQAVELEAETGELSLKANDDVALNGLRVLMNVPRPEEVEAARRKARTLQDFLELPVDPKEGRGRLPRSAPLKRSDW